MKIPEAFLHYVWRMKLFDIERLRTTYGEEVTIQSVGRLNHDQGPDFLDAKVKIGNECLIGNIEMHISNEDWYHHKHHIDPNYNNVILHVVYQPTIEAYILNQAQHQIPILCISDCIAPSLIHHYEQLLATTSDIPCHELISSLPDRLTLRSFGDRLVVERLEQKSKWINDLLVHNQHDIESTFYQTLLAGFGINVNHTFFLNIAQRTPQKILARYIDDLFSLEAILLGQANLLDSSNEYAQRLAKQYRYLQKLHRLSPATERAKYSGLYPASFPTIRLAQFAAFILNQKGLYAQLVSNTKGRYDRSLFEVKVSDFWTHHYTFDKPTDKPIHHRLSDEFVQRLYINSIIPFIYLHDKLRGDSPHRALDMLLMLARESNRVTKRMTTTLGIPNNSAYDSQSIIQWYKAYCTQKRCTDCPIGHQILNSI